MDMHKNAASSPRSRALLVRRVMEQGWTMTNAAEAIGMSERRGWEWLRRYRTEGEAGLQDRSSRPRRFRQTAARIQRRIIRLRRARLTCRRIAEVVGRSRATVARVVGRCGLSRLRALEAPVPIRRYERQRPGELLHIDIKRLARIEGIGHRITGSRQRLKRGIGYEFVHVCIDDATRLTYAEVLACQTWRSVVPFMVRALTWFRDRGVNVERVMTDNGSCYQSHAFQAFCSTIGMRHLRTRPYRRQTNGKAERMIQTLLREWAYLHFYNHHRSHRSHDGRTAHVSRPPRSRRRASRPARSRCASLTGYAVRRNIGDAGQQWDIRRTTRRRRQSRLHNLRFDCRPRGRHRRNASANDGDAKPSGSCIH